MAKKSKIVQNERRKKLVAKYAAKRAALKVILKSSQTSPEDYDVAQRALEALPRNANPNRVRNRCFLTGRPRGYYRKFGVSRIALRELAHNGELPGVTKASW
ncbi:MAG: small subunit ribosomal protein S14 [Myxococcota bacterium]